MNSAWRRLVAPLPKFAIALKMNGQIEKNTVHTMPVRSPDKTFLKKSFSLSPSSNGNDSARLAGARAVDAALEIAETKRKKKRGR